MGSRGKNAAVMVVMVLAGLFSTLTSTSANVPRPAQDCSHGVAQLGPGDRFSGSLEVPHAKWTTVQSSARLCLVGLAANAAYEAKLSYPASHPAVFKLSLAGAPGRSSLRRLLNTEKLIFTTNGNGIPTPLSIGETPSDSSTLLIEVVSGDGLSFRDPDRLEPRKVPFEILLDPLVAGVLPRSVAPLLIVVPVVLFVGFFWIIPALKHAPWSPLNGLFGSSDFDRKRNK